MLGIGNTTYETRYKSCSGDVQECCGNTEKEHLVHSYEGQEGFLECLKDKWNHTGKKRPKEEHFRQREECVWRLVHGDASSSEQLGY